MRERLDKLDGVRGEREDLRQCDVCHDLVAGRSNKFHGDSDFDDSKDDPKEELGQYSGAPEDS